MRFVSALLVLICALAAARFFVTTLPQYFEERFLPSNHVREMPEVGDDLDAVRTGAHAVALGRNPYVYHDDLGPEWEIHYRRYNTYIRDANVTCSYGPAVFYLARPLTWVSRTTSYRIVVALSVLCWLASAALLGSLFRREYRLALLAAFGVLTVVCYPIEFILERGNTDCLMLFLMSVVAVEIAHGRRPWLSGFCVMLATLSKLYPGLLFVYLIARREWRTAFWTAGWTLAAAPIWAGPRLFEFWTAVQKVGQMPTLNMIENHSAASFVSVIRSEVFHAAKDAPGGRLVAAVLLALLYGVTFRSILRAGERSVQRGLAEIGAIVCLMCVSTPLSVDYKLVVLLIPAFAMLYGWERDPGTWGLSGILAVAAVFVPVHFPMNARALWFLPGPIRPLFVPKFLPVVLLWALLIRVGNRAEP